MFQDNFLCSLVSLRLFCSCTTALIPLRGLLRGACFSVMQFSVSIKLLSVRGLQSLGCAGQANYRPIVNLCFTHSLLCEHWLGFEKRLFPWVVLYSVCPLRQLMVRLTATAHR